MTRFHMTLAQLEEQTRLNLDDPDGDRFDEDRLDEALQESLLELAIIGHLTVETIPVSLLANVSVYDLVESAKLAGNSLPIAPLRVGMQDADGRTLPALTNDSLAHLDKIGYRRTQPGRPLRWYRDGMAPGFLGVWMVPDTDNYGTLQVECLCYPAELTAAGTSDVFLPQMQDVLPIGSALRLSLEGKTGGDMQTAAALFNAFYAGARGIIPDRDQAVHHPYNPFRPR